MFDIKEREDVKMVKFKKKLALMLAVVLAVTLLAACGGQKNEGQTTAKAQQSTAKADETDGGKKIDTSKFVTIDYVMLGNKPTNGQVDKMMEKVNAILKEKINANLKYTWVEWADWLTKYNLLLASGEPLDLITSGDWLELWPNAQKGAFLPLDDLLPVYAPATWKEVPQEDWEQCKYNGQIVVLPENSFSQWVNHGMMYRGDWAKEFGINKVTNFDELGRYFQGIVDKKPGVIPFDAGASAQMFHGWVADNTDAIQLDMIPTGFMNIFFAKSFDERYTVMSPVFEQTFLDYANRMKEWGDKKYWREDVLNFKPDPENALLGGKTGAHQHHSMVFSNERVKMDEKQPGSELQFFAFGESRGNIIKMPIIHGATTVGINSKNPERALMVYDLMRNDEEIYRYINYGMEGVQYVIKDGKRYRPEGYDEARDGCYTNFWGGRVDKFEIPGDTTWSGIYDIWAGYEKIAKANPYSRFVPDRSKIEAELAAISDVVSQMAPAIASGKAGDPAKAVEEFRAKLKTAGFDNALKEIQRQFDEYKKLVESK